MEKTAQKRRRRETWRESADIFGRGAESLSPTFRAIMEKLRETDDNIRETLLESDPRLKDVLKGARSNYNRREYMSAVANLVSFHNKIERVVNQLKGLTFAVDEAHHEFIFKDLPTETVKELRSLKEKFEDKKAFRQTNLKKEAGLADLWYILTEERPKALKGWEKRYPAKMKQLKIQTGSLLNKSDQLFSVLLQSLLEMSKARAGRSLDKYLKASEKLVGKFNDYNTEFKKYYQENIKNFLEKLVAQEEAKKQETEKQDMPSGKQVKTEDTGLENKEVATESRMGPPTPVEVPSLPKPSSAPSTSTMAPPSARPISHPVPTLPSTTERDIGQNAPATLPSATERDVGQNAPATEKTSKLPVHVPETPEEIYRQVQQGKIPQAKIPGEYRPTLPSNASKFLSDLELVSESKELMALEINKFAKSIQKSSPQTSMKLFAIVEKILNGK